ncbi:hypothetical protein ACE6H2_014474 [Prunus campanulata]
MVHIPWVTEGLPICASEPVGAGSKDADDFIGSFPGRSESSFRWVFGCQRNLAHNPVPDSEGARFDPRKLLFGRMTRRFLLGPRLPSRMQG